jgi:prephenate dehydrogenase
MAVLTAGRLTDAPAEELELSGPGVRDVTRVAGGDPRLYSQIVGGNAAAVSSLLREVRTQLDELIGALDGGDRGALEALLTRGRAGVEALPAKHGGPARPSTSVFVAIPDEPGVLARLFADVGASGVNVEDLHIDHDLGREVGHLELVVNAASADSLTASLESRGWATHR